MLASSMFREGLHLQATIDLLYTPSPDWAGAPIRYQYRRSFPIADGAGIGCPTRRTDKSSFSAHVYKANR